MNSVAPDGASPETVLVLAPTGRDAPLTIELLEREGMAARACADVVDLCASIERGAGCALVAEEVLTPAALDRVRSTLARQPAWSDFPIVVFGGKAARAELDHAGMFGHITLLDRPVQVRTMLTATRTALRARRQQYEVRRAIDSRDRFLMMLGHELRNPLAAIRLAIEAAAAEQRLLGAAEHAVVDRQSRQLARLVDDLLDVARAVTRKIVLEREAIDLVEVIRGTVQAFEPAARTLALAIEQDLPPSLVVAGDRLRLTQVLHNLVGNAVKYTPAGGRVRVQASAGDGAAEVRVTDDGIGIARELLPHVFDLYTQADRSLDRAGGGMGIGLTVARELARLHGGDIDASSDGAGLGSSFTLRLPMRSVPARPSAPPPIVERSSPLRIVLIDDNDDLRDLLGELLARHGHEVTMAGEGVTGLEEIVRVRPDVALVDLGLPGIDGFEIARRARERAPETRLIAMSGYGQIEDRQRAEEAGFALHLTKPVSVVDLRRALQPP